MSDPTNPSSTAAVKDVRRDQAAQTDWRLTSEWGDAASILEHLHLNTNMVRAAELLDWHALCPPDCTMLDLGCGSGWLTAKLSREPAVRRVLAWDRSPSLLVDVLPETVRLAGGDVAKIERICGEFLPLLLDDSSVDLIVMSSAFHHAETPEQLLRELARVLSRDGAVVLLNETPWHPLALLSVASRTYARMAIGSIVRVKRRKGHIGSHHVLYDETLGDRAYSLRTWHQMIDEAGFAMTVHDTGLPSYTTRYRPRGRLEPNLTHFVLRLA